MTFLPPVLRIIKTFKDIPFHLILFTLSCSNAIFRGLSLVNIKLRGTINSTNTSNVRHENEFFNFPTDITDN